MPTFIPRPDPVGDAFARFLTNESEEAALKHNRDKASRKKKQKTTAIAASAIVGGVAGIATGGAGAATAGEIAAIGAAEGSSLALGAAAGTSALASGLTGAYIGSQVGGQLANEDYAGAIQTGIKGVQGFLSDRENEQFFGGKVTKEGLAAAGRLAEEAGTTLDIIRGEGGTFQEGLNRHRGEAAVRDADARTLNELAGQRAVTIGNSERAHAEDARNKATEASGQERSADPKIVSAIDEDLEKIDADAALYDRSKGSDGASYDELLKRSDITGRYNRAVANPPSKRKKPPLTILNPDGSTREIPYGSAFTQGGKLMLPKFDKDGNLSYSTADQDDPKPLPPSKRVPDNLSPEDSNEWIKKEGERVKRDAFIPEDRWEEFWFNPATGELEQMRPDKGDGKSETDDFLEVYDDLYKSLTMKSSTGKIAPTDEQMRKGLKQRDDFLEIRKKKLAREKSAEEGNEREEVQRGFLNDLGRVFSSKSLKEYGKIVKKIREEYGDDMDFVPEAIKDQLESLGEILKGNRPVEVPSELEGPLGGGAG